ncbi:unnamed protein product [Auanema sp. JU1783]|nr:unnamed protein product [Auanema sp. JU1783]
MKFWAIAFITVAVVFANDEGEDEDQAVLKKAEEILLTHNEGPDKNWIREQREAMASLTLRRSKFSRAEKPENPELEAKLAEYRNSVGPKSNITSEEEGDERPVSPDATEELSGIAIEGDMILSSGQIDNLLNPGGNGNKRRKRSATTDPKAYWSPDESIPFFVESGLNRTRILQAVKFWQDNTCLNFVESRTAGSNRLRFFRGSGCWSYVGKQAFGSQDISIGQGCDSIGTICHEMAHSLGFYHTQSRYDRDDYLDINFGNIQSSLQYNFDKLTSQAETHFGMPYDYGSVMQYNPYAFALDSNVPTSLAKDPNYQNMMGQRESPAFSDVKQMNLVYKCAARCPSTIRCSNGGIINPNDCTKCICPKYFSGDTCDFLGKATAPVCNGQLIQATNRSFTTFKAQTGLGITYQYTDAVECFYSIMSPPGTRIQIQIRNLDASCMESCPWAGFEINMGTPDLAGMLVCCPEAYKRAYTSVSNQILIRGVSKYNNVAMDISYRVV